MKLEFQNVSVAFGSHMVIDRLSLTLEFSRTLALIGPSGGGKSTLLRLIAGLITPTAGKILIDGSPLPDSESDLRTHRSALGIVFQAYNLFPHLSALENVRLPLTAVHRLSLAEASSRAMEILDRFRLGSHAHKKPAALSGGQRQRVAIARAVAPDPGLLLLDEPTSALDPEMTAEVLDLLAELHTTGRRLILATHEMGFGRTIADQVAFVANGRVIQWGPPEEIFSERSSPEIQGFLSRILRY